MIAVVAHDAGSAEMVSSFVRRAQLECLFVLDGPARGIFERKLGALALTSLDEAIGRADWVLCGSGGKWHGDDAVPLARAQGKKSVSVIDHWVHYRERFERDGQLLLPDELWVGDQWAQAIASAAFPGTAIRLIANPYFEDLREQLAARARPQPASGEAVAVLYVCEPVREHSQRVFGDPLYRGYVEEDALRYFIDNIGVLKAPVRQIVMRPHPTEADDKYAWLEREYQLPIRQSRAQLVDDIAACDVVVGCESMTMVVGLLANKRVISCIPPGGKKCVLPQAEIESLQALLQ